MKSKFIKWIGTICVAMMMFSYGGNQVQAADIKQLHIEEYELSENKMRIYMNVDDSVLVGKDNLEIVLGDTTYEAETVTSFSDTKEGVSYLVLVDVSGSVTPNDIVNVREILTELVGMKNDVDNMSIVEIRNEITKTDFVSDKETLLEEIKEIERTSEDTNLYLAIREVLKILNEETACHNKKCLIVISDGKDDQKNGILFEDVRDAIKEEKIPICTLAMPWGGSKAEEPDKVMKSFTENAAGGIYIRYQDGEFDNAGIAKRFSEFAHGGMVAEISLEGFEPNGSMVTLSVDSSDDNNLIKGDSYEIPSYAISSVIVKEEPADVAEETVMEIENEESSVTQYKWIYPVVILVGIVAVALVVIVCVKKKGKKEESTLDSGSKEKEESAASSEKMFDYEVATPTKDGEEELVAMQNEEEVEKCYITLTEIGPMATRVLHAEFTDSLVIGRRKSSGLAITDDNQVSGTHCKLWMDAGVMYVVDLDSTNGTILNGVPVTVRQQVRQEDIIMIGAFEYRISWK